jgi:hypothetical protein
VQPSDPDPLPNTASASCSPVGFPNVLTDSASHSVNLFQPSITMTKDCAPVEVAPGDPVNYTITVNNTSSADSPDLECDISDPLLGLNKMVTLSSGDSDVSMVARNVQPGDANPLVNTASTSCSPIGFPNELPAEDSCSVDIVGCALSPGGWGGGSGFSKRDEACDPTAIAAGFTTETLFPWLDASCAGLSYFEVLKLSAQGDVTRQLSFKYIAARLNEATFGVPSGIDTLLNEIDMYFMTNPVCSDPDGAAGDEGQSLKTQLDAYFSAVGEENCPVVSTLPECQ